MSDYLDRLDVDETNEEWEDAIDEANQIIDDYEDLCERFDELKYYDDEELTDIFRIKWEEDVKALGRDLCDLVSHCVNFNCGREQSNIWGIYYDLEDKINEMLPEGECEDDYAEKNPIFAHVYNKYIAAYEIIRTIMPTDDDYYGHAVYYRAWNKLKDDLFRRFGEDYDEENYGCFEADEKWREKRKAARQEAINEVEESFTEAYLKRIDNSYLCGKVKARAIKKVAHGVPRKMTWKTRQGIDEALRGQENMIKYSTMRETTSWAKIGATMGENYAEKVIYALWEENDDERMNEKIKEIKQAEAQTIVAPINSKKKRDEVRTNGIVIFGRETADEQIGKHMPICTLLYMAMCKDGHIKLFKEVDVCARHNSLIFTDVIFGQINEEEAERLRLDLLRDDKQLPEGTLASPSLTERCDEDAINRPIKETIMKAKIEHDMHIKRLTNLSY